MPGCLYEPCFYLDKYDKFNEILHPYPHCYNNATVNSNAVVMRYLSDCPHDLL